MLHKCPTCKNVYDCANKNYCLTEAFVAYYTKDIPLDDIRATITKENVECASDDYDVQCIYCQIERDLGIEWE